MNPGPGFGGPGIDGVGIGGLVVTVLVLGALVLLGVLVLRRLSAIERAVHGAQPATPVATPVDADARAGQQPAELLRDDGRQTTARSS